jgi:hypothetical protein
MFHVKHRLPALAAGSVGATHTTPLAQLPDPGRARHQPLARRQVRPHAHDPAALYG